MPEYFRDHLRKRDVMASRVSGRGVEAIYRSVSPMPATPDYETAQVTGIILGPMAGRNQCHECGWYSAENRPARRIRHFDQCSQYNPRGVTE